MKNPAKTFAQIGVSRARAGTVRARLWHRKGGIRPRYDRFRRFPARSRRADVRTIPDVTSRVHLSRCLVISSPTRKQRLIIAGGLCTYRPPAIETHRRERRRGPAFRAGRYYPRSAREFATCGGSRAPPRCVPPTRLFKSKGLKERVRKGDDTGSRWIQTLSYNSRNGGTLLTLFADCQLVSRIFSPRCLCVARCFGKNLWGALSVAGVPLEVYNKHARPHRRRSSLALGRARGEHAGSYPSGEGSNGGKARG